MNWKRVGYKLLTYTPGVGLIAYGIKEYKTRKGKSPWYNIKDSKDRRALGVYPLEVGYFALALSWKVWLGNGIATGEWNPFKYFDSKPRTEQIENLSKKDKSKKSQKPCELEKTIDYE
ncbi:MAG: hypothetical protein NTZ83_04435 [Candidatus Pacearchaeota archaeon]|nr:hypothetical protein [Candidatus Pacearchaeota archaeon]